MWQQFQSLYAFVWIVKIHITDGISIIWNDLRLIFCLHCSTWGRQVVTFWPSQLFRKVFTVLRMVVVVACMAKIGLIWCDDVINTKVFLSAKKKLNYKVAGSQYMCSTQQKGPKANRFSYWQNRKNWLKARNSLKSVTKLHETVNEID